MYLGLQIDNLVHWYQVPQSSLDRDVVLIKGMIQRNVLVGVHRWIRHHEPNEIHSHEALETFIHAHLHVLVEIPTQGYLYLTVTSLLGEEFHYIFPAAERQDVLFHAEENKQEHKLADYRVSSTRPASVVQCYSEFLQRLKGGDEYMSQYMRMAEPITA
jgi:hypothetical protein